MPKEYRTIQEVAGPLMLVHGVEDVAYDELGEIDNLQNAAHFVGVAYPPNKISKTVLKMQAF